MKKLLCMILSIAMLTMMIGCGNDNKTEKKAQAKPIKELNVTYVKAPLNIPSIVDKANGTTVKAFEKDGIQVKFADITSGAKQTEALASGSLDIASVLGGTSAILAASNGADIKIVGMYSRAPKAFNIMVKDENIKSVADLKGKKVAGPKGTILHQILVAALAKENMKADAVEFVSLGIPAGVNAMMKGEVDAALVAGPAVLKAQQAGARVLVNGDGLVNASIVMGVSGKILKEHPEIVKKYIEVQKENLAFMQKEQDKAFEMTAKETGLTPEQVKTMAPWYDFSMEVKPSDVKDLEDTQEFLLAQGMQSKKIDIKSLIVDVK